MLARDRPLGAGAACDHMKIGPARLRGPAASLTRSMIDFRFPAGLLERDVADIAALRRVTTREVVRGATAHRHGSRLRESRWTSDRARGEDREGVLPRGGETGFRSTRPESSPTERYDRTVSVFERASRGSIRGIAAEPVLRVDALCRVETPSTRANDSLRLKAGRRRSIRARTGHAPTVERGDEARPCPGAREPERALGDARNGLRTGRRLAVREVLASTLVKVRQQRRRQAAQSICLMSSERTPMAAEVDVRERKLIVVLPGEEHEEFRVGRREPRPTRAERVTASAAYVSARSRRSCPLRRCP